jgi:hypothetical protein
MKGYAVMPDRAELSEARRALLAKYLRGDVQQAARIGTQHAEAEVGSPRHGVVPIQTGGSRRPFFFLHGHWQGTPVFCFPLARELGSDRPFYALEPYQFDGLPVPPTVETMAAAHITSMRSIQPEGPYLLGGWCNGGLVAYEMARQLHAAGQTVDVLVLMDAMFLGYRTGRRFLRGVISRLGNLMGLGPDKQLDWFLRLLRACKPLQHAYFLRTVYIRLRNVRHGDSQDPVRLIMSDVISPALRKVMTGIKRFASMFAHRHIALSPLASLVPKAEGLRQDYAGIFEWVDMGYAPPSLYAGKITFFWPSDDAWHTISGGWHKITQAKATQEIEAYVIPGHQETWRSEHLHELAACLRTCLSKTEKE